MKIIYAGVVALFCSSVQALPTCPEMEYAEIKDMSADRLKKEYCASVQAFKEVAAQI